MATVSRDPIMPDEILESFPWKDQLHAWDFGLSARPAIRLRIWNVMPEDYHAPFREVCARASIRHNEMWDWLTERYEMVEMPEFESEGQVYVKDGEQHYDYFAIYSTFHLGRRRESHDA